MKKILFIYLLTFLSLANASEKQKYNWEFSYDMKIETLNFTADSKEREEFLKESISQMLKDKSTYCASSDYDVKKEIKKLFKGCNIFHEEKQNKLFVEITCEPISYNLYLTEKYHNKYYGEISLSSSDKEFNLKTKGPVSLIKKDKCD